LVKISIIAVGKSRKYAVEWCAEYTKRLTAQVTIREVIAPKALPPAQTQKTEAALVLKALPPRAFIVVLDERGKNLSSRELAIKLRGWQEQNSEIVFVIGGADGVTDNLRARAHFILGFGHATWPHQLVRVMLIEQIYRAQQINVGHPYHRD
jgi:23S rRNA (pseudouridine1915-N3)-methyltransferase